MNSGPQKRFVPILLMSDRDLVKGRQFTDYRYIGDPCNTLTIFNSKRVDEIVIYDISARKGGNGPDFEYLDFLSSSLLLPASYGGGIRSVDDAHRLFFSGFEKVHVCISSSEGLKIEQRARLIYDLSVRFGSQSAVAVVDVIETEDGYRAWDFQSSSTLDISVEDLFSLATSSGAGELVVNNVTRDGMGTGLDKDLALLTGKRWTGPTIIAGGASIDPEIKNFALETTPNISVGLGSRVVFCGPLDGVLISYPKMDKVKK